jgi:Ni,Fe-hydrogenase III small subunit
MISDFIAARLKQGTPTARVPVTDVSLPPRFRGRPSQREPLPMLDLGTCLFSPEEASDALDHAVTFTRDPRMASSSRDGLRLSGADASRVEALAPAMRALFGRSLRLRSVAAGSCGGCEAELTALGNVVFDMARFGVQFVASPRHADGLVVSGAVSRNMEGALKATWEAIAEPKLVIVVGACAVSGGPFRGSPEVRNGIPDDIPVDLWIPGCPPHPMTVLDGLLRLLGR